MIQSGIDDTHLLVAFSTAKGENFILKLSVATNVLKIIITDKATAEKWRCTYDSVYIESLTRKTGNFKQFKVFVSMLRAGLLKTNECVFIELLSQCELEARRRKGPKVPSNPNMLHRKYLILVYQVEFDKIHYPLPLEYCGKPSPDVLQATVRKLESEIVTLKSELNNQRMRTKEEMFSREESLQNLVDQLNKENKILYDEINKLKLLLGDKNGRPCSNKTIKKMEDQMKKERSKFTEKIYRLEIENRKLTSLLSGRALCSRVPVQLNYDSGYNRLDSGQRNRRSRSLDRSPRQNSKGPRSPLRKLSSASSETCGSTKKSPLGILPDITGTSTYSGYMSPQCKKPETKRNKKKKNHSKCSCD